MTVSTGIITTIAGTGTTTYSGDNGPATSAGVDKPSDVTLDSAGTSLIYSLCFTVFSQLFLLYLGNVYIADSTNCIRKVTVSTGIITTIAGSSTSSGYSGDNGPATAASLNTQLGVALDASGTHSSLLC